MKMFESWIEWMRGKHAPTGKTADILEILERLPEGKGFNQANLALMIEEPEY